MTITVNWRWTAITLSLFLGSFLGAYFYSAYNESGINHRVKTLESTMEAVAESTLVSLRAILELKKRNIVSNYNFVESQGTVEFDPNEIMEKYFYKE